MVNYPITVKTFVFGASIALLFLSGWEWHWRAEGYYPAPDDDKHLWAEQRAKLEKAGKDDVVLLGSSRVLFDIQLNEWEAATGKRPVMLAAAGSNPIPVLKDIVEHSQFAGTLIIGVTPPLYFSPLDNNYRPYRRICNWVTHYHDRTYADRLNHQLAKITQHNLAFLNTSEDGHNTDLNLKELIKDIELPPRVPGPPRWPSMATMDKDRNITTLKALENDTSYARRVTNFWDFILQPPKDMPPPEVIEKGRLGTIEVSTSLIEKFKARGGKVIFVRCPSQQKFNMVENKAFPRDKYWQDLLDATGCPGYHFEDYDFMNKYTLPEWSHLKTSDARQFTLDLVRQMQQDGVL